MNIALNARGGVTKFYLHFHNRKQALLPSFRKRFGAALADIKLPGGRAAAAYEVRQKIELARTRWRSLDSSEERCNDSAEEPKHGQFTGPFPSQCLKRQARNLGRPVAATAGGASCCQASYMTE